MGFDDKVTALAAAHADAQTAFVAAITPARDAYVQQRQTFAQAEDRWLHDIANDDARIAARDAWQTYAAARKALADTATAAAATRTATLEAAWTDIKTR